MSKEIQVFLIRVRYVAKVGTGADQGKAVCGGDKNAQNAGFDFGKEKIQK